MNTVFVGGSRHISRLPTPAKERLDNIVKNGFRILVGDANGGDKAVQKHLSDVAYGDVEVFCSGDICRNNLGAWPTRKIQPAKGAKGFQFYAAKDREMAQAADFGLMIWNGKSPGTMLNVLRLIKADKKAVLFNCAEATTTTFKARADWAAFLAHCEAGLKSELEEPGDPRGMVAPEPAVGIQAPPQVGGATPRGRTGPLRAHQAAALHDST